MAVDKIVDHMSGIERARVTAPSRTTAYLRRGDTEQSINRIFSRTGNVQQQEASHYAEIFIKAIHTVDSIRTRHCPIAMSDKRGSQRVKNISTAAGRVKAPMATANATGSSMKVATAAAGSGVGTPSCAI